jgi:hypothetical protein
MTSSKTPSALEVAREYTRRNYRTVPVPYRGKALYEDGWQTWRLDESDLTKHFNGHAQNVGVLMGEPSGGLIDIDCDSPESVALAAVFLPATPSTFGRASKRRSHWLYKADPIKATTKFKDVDGKMIAEYRSTGCQTVMPGSTHETGELITWDEDGTPAAVDGGYLLDCVSKLAAASNIAAHWPAQGSRQEAALALAGGLLRGGWEDQEVREFIEGVADAAGDPETRKRASTAQFTRRRLEADKTATGWPTLAELLAEDRDALLLLDGVLLAAADWEKAEPEHKGDFLAHRGSRLAEAQARAARGAANINVASITASPSRLCMLACAATSVPGANRRNLTVRARERVTRVMV